jgi:diadenosine tetraphosphate (Ap4A) HIT family hydrolase
MTATECPLCNLSDDRIWVQTDSAIAILDKFPVSPGHTLIIPGKHIGALLELPENDLNEIWLLVAHIRKLLIEKYKPDGFNIGINEGSAAGQMVMHSHIHLIPRFNGDVADPRGGVRWVVPARAKYW